LGRKILEAILGQPGWAVRILTKNAEVEHDFDLIERHRDRVVVGLSLTGTPDKEHVISCIEPWASPISD
jgi:DNA repair photolyase